MEEGQTEVQAKDNALQTKRPPQETKLQEKGSHETPSKNIPPTRKSKPRKKRRFKFASFD
jgi:hypothetical protein